MAPASPWLPLAVFYLATLTPSRPAHAKPRFEPIIVVEDRAEIDRRLREVGVPFEGTFVATLDDGRRARGDLVRFVRADLKSADRKRARQLRRILLTEKSYVWHCGGFERSGGQYLHCSLVRYRDGDERLRQPLFPTVSDGGTDVARCIFSVKAGQVVTLSWNGEG